jgi:hypothetical protein
MEHCKAKEKRMAGSDERSDQVHDDDYKLNRFDKKTITM